MEFFVWLPTAIAAPAIWIVQRLAEAPAWLWGAAAAAVLAGAWAARRNARRIGND